MPTWRVRSSLKPQHTKQKRFRFVRRFRQPRLIGWVPMPNDCRCRRVVVCSPGRSVKRSPRSIRQWRWSRLHPLPLHHHLPLTKANCPPRPRSHGMPKRVSWPKCVGCEAVSRASPKPHHHVIRFGFRGQRSSCPNHLLHKRFVDDRFYQHATSEFAMS